MLTVKSQNTLNIQKNTDIATQMKKTSIADENEVCNIVQQNGAKYRNDNRRSTGGLVLDL